MSSNWNCNRRLSACAVPRYRQSVHWKHGSEPIASECRVWRSRYKGLPWEKMEERAGHDHYNLKSAK